MKLLFFHNFLFLELKRLRICFHRLTVTTETFQQNTLLITVTTSAGLDPLTSGVDGVDQSVGVLAADTVDELSVRPLS